MGVWTEPSSLGSVRESTEEDSPNQLLHALVSSHAHRTHKCHFKALLLPLSEKTLKIIFYSNGYRTNNDSAVQRLARKAVLREARASDYREGGPGMGHLYT